MKCATRMRESLAALLSVRSLVHTNLSPVHMCECTSSIWIISCCQQDGSCQHTFCSTGSLAPPPTSYLLNLYRHTHRKVSQHTLSCSAVGGFTTPVTSRATTPEFLMFGFKVTPLLSDFNNGATTLSAPMKSCC